MIIRRTNCQKNKEITYDTVVVGGGIAGVSAAASAAKNGSKTLLIESATFLGGVVTMGPLEADRKSTRLNSSHIEESRMPSSA